MIRERSL